MTSVIYYVSRTQTLLDRAGETYTTSRMVYWYNAQGAADGQQKELVGYLVTSLLRHNSLFLLSNKAIN